MADVKDMLNQRPVLVSEVHNSERLDQFLKCFHFISKSTRSLVVGGKDIKVELRTKYQKIVYHIKHVGDVARVDQYITPITTVNSKE